MSESRIAKAQKNIMTSLIQNFVSIGINFASRMIFVRILDESYLGINGLFSNILNILSLADLGMATVMMYSLYVPIENGDKKKIAALVSFFRKIYLGIALTVLIAGIGMIPFLDFIVNLDQPLPFLEGYYTLALLNVVISYLFVYRTTLISADQKTYILNQYSMIFKMITFAVQTVALIFFKNYLIYLFAALVISFISNIFQNLAALKLYPYLKNDTEKLDKEERKKIFYDVKAMFIYKISGAIQSNTDHILISVFVGTVSVGYYSNYAMAVAQIVVVITLVFNSLKASVGNFIVSGEAKEEEKHFLFQVCETLNFWIVGFCSICFVSLFQDFIALCFGEGFLLEFGIVIAVVLNFYTTHIRQAIWMFRETTGIFQETKCVTLVTAVLNVIFSLAFGSIWGMVGILAATILAKLLYAFWKEPIILYRIVFKRSVASYFSAYIKNALLCILAGVLTYVSCGWVPMENPLFGFFLKILICCIAPNVVFFCCFWKTKEFQYIIKRLVLPLIQKTGKKSA